MPEFTLQDVRRLYMISALYPKQSWEYKKVAYDGSADEYGDMHRSVTSLKSYWNLHRQHWGRIHLLGSPPSTIPNDQADPQGQQDRPTESSTQDTEGLLRAQDQIRQHDALLSARSDNYLGQRQVQPAAPVFEYPMSYVGQAMLERGDQQDQQDDSMGNLSADCIYSPYPIQSASANHGAFFADTTYGNIHFADASSGWNTGHGVNLPIAAGQQPVGVASYFSAGSVPNAYMACNPSIAFTPQTMHCQPAKPGYLEQIPEHEHDGDSQESATCVEDSEDDSGSGSEGQS